MDNEKINDAGSEEGSIDKKSNDDLIRTIELNKRWCLEHLDILKTF